MTALAVFSFVRNANWFLIGWNAYNAIHTEYPGSAVAYGLLCVGSLIVALGLGRLISREGQ